MLELVPTLETLEFKGQAIPSFSPSSPLSRGGRGEFCRSRGPCTQMRACICTCPRIGACVPLHGCTQACSQAHAPSSRTGPARRGSLPPPPHTHTHGHTRAHTLDDLDSPGTDPASSL